MAKNSPGILKITLLSVCLAIVVTSLDGPKSGPMQILSFLLFATVEIFLLILLFAWLCAALSRVVSRWISDPSRRKLFAISVAALPVFLYWSYRINILFLPKMLGFKSISWNIIFVAVYGLICLFLWKFLPPYGEPGSFGNSRNFYRILLPVILLFTGLACFRFYSVWGESPGSLNNQKRSLAIAKPQPGNPEPAQNAFLFDQRIQDAAVESADPFVQQSMTNFNFDATDSLRLQPVHAQHISSSSNQKGILRIAIKDQVSALETREFLQPAAEIYAIVIKLKMNKGKHFELWWKRQGEKEFTSDLKTRVIVSAQNKFLTFAIKTRKLQGWSGIIDGLRFFPTNQPDSVVELDYIHFLTAHEYFSSKSGTGSFELNSELRKVMYTHSPSSLRYNVVVPEKGSLSFGMAIMDAAFPTDFQVVVSADGQKQQLYAQTIRDQHWHDAMLDLSRWENRKVTITFRTSSPQKGSLAFWSNPVLYSQLDQKRRPNILVYLIDCLRADHTTPYGYVRDTTPNLKKFSNEGITFLNAYSQFTATRGSVASLFTSQYYSAHRTGMEVDERLSDNFQTIAEELRAGGYNTVSFLENINAGPPGNLDQGFEQMFLKGLNAGGDRYGEISAIRDWTGNHPKPNRSFFLYVHSLELHEPYQPPEQYYKKYLPGLSGSVEENYRKHFKQESDRFMLSRETIDHLVNVYDGAISLADARFGAVLEALREAGLYEDTVIIVTADHGESFHEQLLWAHGVDPYQALIRVPLIMRFPLGMEKAKSISQNVQLIDVAPTLLDVAGQKGNADFQGFSLLPLIQNQQIDRYRDRSIFSEGQDWNGLAMNKFRDRQKFHRVATVTGQWKTIAFKSMGPLRSFAQATFPLMFDFFRLTRNELYDLANDPGEHRNLFAIGHEKGKENRNRFDEWSAKQDEISRKRIGSPSEDKGGLIDPEDQEELKALGYIQ